MGKIEELLKDKYKLRIPPTVYYDLLADVVEIEEDQEPTTKNDLGVASELEKNSKKLENDFGELDCISRADALALYCDKCGVYNCISKCSSYRAVEKMPSVTPQEPKTGHWIANAPQYDMLNPQYICSECGNAHTRTTPYCEMCGAKMVEPQESEVDNGNNNH